MKSLFCYTLTLALATSSLVAGPKPILGKKSDSSGPADPQTSIEQQTEISRRKYDPLPADGESNDAAALQARNPSASASIAESKSPEDGSALDATKNSGQNHSMELTRPPSRLDTSIIEDYIPSGSSAEPTESKSESSSADRRMAAVPLSTTRDLDQQRLLLGKTIAELKESHAALQQQTEKTARNSAFVVKSTIAKLNPCLPPPTSRRLDAKIAAVEDAQADLDIVLSQFGAQRVEELFSEITEDSAKIYVFNSDQGVKEKAPIAQSFKFGILIRQELQQLQQKTIANKLMGNVGAFGRSDPFEDMMVDLSRTHDRPNVRFSLNEGATATLLNQERGEDNLETFKNFVGENQHLQVAIASVMHQGGQSDFESIKLGAQRDAAEQNSLPFFTEGVNKQMWRPPISGPIFMKLFAGENKTESQSYDLQKITSESGSPVFQLTTTCTQSIEDPDFHYALTRDVTYQFEENHSFNPNQPICEDNSPVTIKCLEGKIVQSFGDVRTPEEFHHQAAQYNLTVYQRKLDELGDPHQIETEYQNRIHFLASKAASRPGSIMTQDRNAAEAKLQQLRKAQQDVTRAQQEVIHSQRRLDGIPNDETDSQPGFEDDNN